jgi:hypothetical protein
LNSSSWIYSFVFENETYNAEIDVCFIDYKSVQKYCTSILLFAFNGMLSEFLYTSDSQPEFRGGVSCQISKFIQVFFPTGTTDCNFKPSKDTAKYFSLVQSVDMNKKGWKPLLYIRVSQPVGRSSLMAPGLFLVGHQTCINVKQKHIKVNLNCYKACKKN